MALGSDHQTCTTEFVEAMRAKLDQRTPPSGANVDRPDVRPNFEALGEAVFQILSARADTRSQPAQDPAFWNWAEAVSVRLAELRGWQQGLRQAVQNWSPPDVAGQQLRAAILDLTLPGSAPTSPASLTGRIQ
jgi:hypothetical protein